MNMMSGSDSSLPRQLTAIGTMGEMGQLFTVYEKNWNCKECGQENYASRPRCFRCKKQKPQGETNYVLDPALEAARSHKTIQWQEVVDPATYQIYYHNKETNAVQWERPEEMGPAPLATGWFGRGVAGSTAAQQYKKQNDEYLTRPARKQKDFIDPKKFHMEGANEYNIWYGKYLGDYDKGAKQEAATDRCVLSSDAGMTRADSGGKKEKRSFCIHFAHGVCAKGKDCTYYHRVPLPEDDARTDEMMDCFGRQRHAQHRDDMDGVGSFMKPCRTLFIGNLLKNKYASPKALEDALWKHFGEWGELESLNVIHRLSIAFPRYRLRTSAEFAKEAMQGQTLDESEILSIRWAHDDPNPVAQDAISRADKDALSLLLTAKGVSVAPANFEYPSDYAVPQPDSKRLRLEDGTEVSPDIAYPNTDQQYASMTSNHDTTQQMSAEVYQQYFASMTEEQYKAYCESYYAQQSQTSSSESSDAAANEKEVSQPNNSTISSESETKLSSFLTDLIAPNSSNDSSSKMNSATSAAVMNEWTEHIDDDTGATYYYNATSGESSWEQQTVL